VTTGEKWIAKQNFGSKQFFEIGPTVYYFSGHTKYSERLLCHSTSIYHLRILIIPIETAF